MESRSLPGQLAHHAHMRTPASIPGGSWAWVYRRVQQVLGPRFAPDVQHHHGFSSILCEATRSSSTAATTTTAVRASKPKGRPKKSGAPEQLSAAAAVKAGSSSSSSSSSKKRAADKALTESVREHEALAARAQLLAAPLLPTSQKAQVAPPEQPSPPARAAAALTSAPWETKPPHRTSSAPAAQSASSTTSHPTPGTSTSSSSKPSSTPQTSSTSTTTTTTTAASASASASAPGPSHHSAYTGAPKSRPAATTPQTSQSGGGSTQGTRPTPSKGFSVIAQQAALTMARKACMQAVDCARKTPSVSPLSLPGMAGTHTHGSEVASMHELLSAIQPLPPQEVYAMVAQLYDVFYKPRPLDAHRVFFLDIEHTGHVRSTCRVIDICLLDISTGDKFSTLIDPQEWIPPLSSQIHNITNSTVAGAPKGPHVWLALLLWVHQKCEQPHGGARPLFVAHNAWCDSQALGCELARMGFLMPNSWAQLCTMELAKAVAPGLSSYSLSNLLNLYQIDTRGLQMHRAETDCVLTKSVMDKMLEQAFGPGSNFLQSVNLGEEERAARGLSIKTINSTGRFTRFLGIADRLYPPLRHALFQRYVAATCAAGDEPYMVGEAAQQQQQGAGGASKGGRASQQGAAGISKGGKAVSGKEANPVGEALQQGAGVSKGGKGAAESGEGVAVSTGGGKGSSSSSSSKSGSISGKSGSSVIAESGNVSSVGVTGAEGRSVSAKGVCGSSGSKQAETPSSEGRLHAAPPTATAAAAAAADAAAPPTKKRAGKASAPAATTAAAAAAAAAEQDKAVSEMLREAASISPTVDAAGAKSQVAAATAAGVDAAQNLGQKVGAAARLDGVDQAHLSGVSGEGGGPGMRANQQATAAQHDAAEQQIEAAFSKLVEEEALAEEAEEAAAAGDEQPGFVWSLEGGGVEQQQYATLSGSERWREADPVADIELYYDEQAVAGTEAVSGPQAESPVAAEQEGPTPTEQAPASAPKEALAKKAQIPPLWSHMSQPPYKERTPTKKWFTAAQLAKLELSGMDTLLGLLSYYPRAYKAFTPHVQTHLAEQCVEVTAKVIERKVISLHGKGQAVLSMLVEAPLAGGGPPAAPFSNPALQGLSSGSVNESSSGSSSDAAPAAQHPSTTLICVTKFAAGGMWAGRSLEALDKSLGDRFTLKASVESVEPGEEGDTLKWFGKARSGPRPMPQWRTMGTPELTPLKQPSKQPATSTGGVHPTLETLNLQPPLTATEAGTPDQHTSASSIATTAATTNNSPANSSHTSASSAPAAAQPSSTSPTGLPQSLTALSSPSAAPPASLLTPMTPVTAASLPSSTKMATQGYALEPVYSALTPFKPDDFFSTKPSKAGKDVIARALDGVRAMAAGAGTPELVEPLACLPSLEGLQLMSWIDALYAVHRPSTFAALSAGRRQLAFQEMFFMQLQLLQRRRDFLRRMASIAPTAHISDTRAVDALRRHGAAQGLPYALTGAQERALAEILDDLRRPVAMLRLLQGDVGSGKTIVAMLAMLAAASSGYQSLLLVPTGILAHQHFDTLRQLVGRLPPQMQQAFGEIVLLTGGLKVREKRGALGAVQSGASRLVVSTHSALFTSDWHKLGLVVIDEQHKFGVRQKETVMELCKHFQPHILSMSATPIPRTMALVKYGEMVVSALYELPPNRQHVATSVVEDTAQGRQRVHEAIKAELEAGGRAFIVYPLRSAMKEADKLQQGGAVDVEVPEGDLRSATAEFERLQKQKVFGTNKCVLLHGGMKLEEKTAAVDAFRSGQRPVMVCTTVVEVGVDVSQASIIVVEHADRFGLAQLHQLRGRVGRGVLQSKCLLLAPGEDTPAAERLKVMESCHNGLDIAEADLHLRGGGSVFNAGVKQSGGVDASALCSEEVAKDPRIVEVARALAANTLMAPGGMHPQLQLVASAHDVARKTGGWDAEAAGGFAV